MYYIRNTIVTVMSSTEHQLGSLTHPAGDVDATCSTRVGLSSNPSGSLKDIKGIKVQ